MPQNMQIVCRFPMVRHKSDSWQTIFLCNEHNRYERRGHFAVSVSVESINLDEGMKKPVFTNID